MPRHFPLYPKPEEDHEDAGIAAYPATYSEPQKVGTWV